MKRKKHQYLGCNRRLERRLGCWQSSVSDDYHHLSPSWPQGQRPNHKVMLGNQFWFWHEDICDIYDIQSDHFIPWKFKKAQEMLIIIQKQNATSKMQTEVFPIIKYVAQSIKYAWCKSHDRQLWTKNIHPKSDTYYPTYQ